MFVYWRPVCCWFMAAVVSFRWQKCLTIRITRFRWSLGRQPAARLVARVLCVNPKSIGETMKAIGLIGLCIFLGACAASISTKPQPREVSKPLTDSEKAYISKVETDGRLLYEKDIRAAAATDLLLSKINPADYPNFVGWVTYLNSEDFTVSFYEKSGENFKVIADVNFKVKGSPAIDLNPSRIMTET